MEAALFPPETTVSAVLFLITYNNTRLSRWYDSAAGVYSKLISTDKLINGVSWLISKWNEPTDSTLHIVSLAVETQ